jgi:hypothetical protein
VARTSSSERLQQRLGLSEDELLQVLDADALEIITGDADLKPEVGILLALTEDIDEGVLRRWLRTGTHLQALLARDFAAFEDALDRLRSDGLRLRGGG